MVINLNKVKINQAVKSGLSLFERQLKCRKRKVWGAVILCVVGFSAGAVVNGGGAGASIPVGFSGNVEHMNQNDLMEYAYDLQNKVANEPEELYEFTAQQVSLMLAEPDLERKDFPSVSWQYRSASCVVEVFYTSSNADQLDKAQVQHFEIRPRTLITAKTGKDVDDWGCLQSLYTERQKVIEAGFRQIFAQAEKSQNDS